MLQINEDMMDVVGVVQHHDAITGTAKQLVADDYSRRVYEGMQVTRQAYS